MIATSLRNSCLWMTRNISRVKSDLDFMYGRCNLFVVAFVSFVLCAPPSDSNLCHAPLQQLRLDADTTIITIFRMMEEHG